MILPLCWQSKAFASVYMSSNMHLLKQPTMEAVAVE